MTDWRASLEAAVPAENRGDTHRYIHIDDAHATLLEAIAEARLDALDEAAAAIGYLPNDHSISKLARDLVEIDKANVLYLKKKPHPSAHPKRCAEEYEP